MQTDKRGYGLVYREFMRNQSLTIESKAIFNYLVSFAGQKEECYPGKELMLSELNISEQRFDKHMKQLVDKGYIEKKRLRKNGKLSNNVYKVEPFPYSTLDIEKPHIENLGIENQGVENLGIENLGMENKGANNNSIKSNSINNKYIDHFNKFWNAYPKKVAKASAEKAFNKIKVDDELLKKILSSLEIQKKSRQWQDKQFIPHASTYLNQRRWEDEEDIIDYDTGTIKIADDGAIQL